MKRENHFLFFNPKDQLRPKFSKRKFKTLTSWDLAWELLEPINIASGKRDEKRLAKRLSAGQKALYFFWYLDAEVTNGGFIQFYHNGFDYYLPSIIEGLKLIGDLQMLELVEKADKLYQKHKEDFELVTSIEGFSQLYSKLKSFSKLDDKYYAIHDNTISLLEKYARLNPAEFVTLT